MEPLLTIFDATPTDFPSPRPCADSSTPFSSTTSVLREDVTVLLREWIGPRMEPARAAADPTGPLPRQG